MKIFTIMGLLFCVGCGSIRQQYTGWYVVKLVEAPFDDGVFEKRPNHRLTNWNCWFDVDSICGDSVFARIEVFYKQGSSVDLIIGYLDEVSGPKKWGDREYYRGGEVVGMANCEEPWIQKIAIHVDQGIFINEITSCGTVEHYGLFLSY